jgi:hypothetical protein
MTDDGPVKREAIPANEPLEVWWPNYLARVKASAEAAEQHLEVPAGTITSIPGEPDFIATVKTYAVIEPILNELIATGTPRPGSGSVAGALQFIASGQSVRENFRTFVAALNMSGRTGKLRLAQGMGLLVDHHVDFIEAVTRVRNRYAHNVKNMHRSLPEILMEEQASHGRIVEHLTGLHGKLPLPSGLDNSNFLKSFMYHRLADYLSNALDTLRPPPLPTLGPGALSGLFEEPPANEERKNTDRE